MKYKSVVKVGIDEFTLVLMAKDKIDFMIWEQKAETMLKEFLDLAKLEDMFGELVMADYGDMFGELVMADYGIQKGYTDGLTFDNRPWHFSISWHEYLQNMGICIKFSAHAWAVYQTTYFEKYGEEMNITIFLRNVQSDNYLARLSRIDFTADYFNFHKSNFHKSFNPDTLSRGLNNGTIAIKDYKNRSMLKNIQSVEKNGVISTLYLGSKKSNTRCFARIYDKRLEQIDTKGIRYDEALKCKSWIRQEVVFKGTYSKKSNTRCFARIYDKRLEQIDTKGIRYDEALKCKSWIRQEVVFKGTYSHQITEDLLNITTQIELQQYIAQKITEKYRFYDTTTKNEMKYTRALLYIMNNAEFNHLSSVQVKDNDYMRSLKYLMNGSGLYPTLYKALEVWGEGADKEVVKYLFDNYEKFYISEAHKKKDLRSWIKKHRADLRQQTLKDYLRGV